MTTPSREIKPALKSSTFRPTRGEEEEEFLSHSEGEENNQNVRGSLGVEPGTAHAQVAEESLRPHRHRDCPPKGLKEVRPGT